MFFKHVLDLDGVLGNLVLGAIVSHTIVEYQFHVVDKLVHILVYVECQLFLDCSEVHRLLDYVEIVVNAVFAGVHGLVEEISAFGFPAH